MTILCFCLFKGDVTLPGVKMALSTPRCAPKTQNNPNADPSPFSCIQSGHFCHDSSQKKESHHPDLFAFGQLPTRQNNSVKGMVPQSFFNWIKSHFLDSNEVMWYSFFLVRGFYKPSKFEIFCPRFCLKGPQIAGLFL